MLQDQQPESRSLTDNQLALAAKQADSNAFDLLVRRYQPVARSLAYGRNVAGLEAEDLSQEALIGLMKAVRSFDGRVPFYAYACLCMRRQVFSALRAGSGGKHRPLVDYVPWEDSQLSVYGPEAPHAESAESLVIQDEEQLCRTQHIHSLLSAFEQVALNLYLSGHSYEEMAKRLNSTPKAVDNALQRVRRKLRSMKL